MTGIAAVVMGWLFILAGLVGLFLPFLQGIVCHQAIRAVAGSSIVHLLVGLKYDHKLWAEMWPRIIANTIEACTRAHAKLIFFDNVYMYGKVNGAKRRLSALAARRGKCAQRSPTHS